MKKNTFFVLSLILIFVMAFTAMTGCSDSKETGAPAETSGGDTRTLVGTIEDIANATIAVRDEEGETYIFERDDSLVVSTDGLMLIGEDIHVVYVGELTQSESVQDVKVLSFYIEASKEQAAGEQPAEDGQESQPASGQVSSGQQPAAGNDARQILQSMSLEEKVAQMFIVRCPESGAADLISEDRFGGYILFARDFKNRTADQVRAEIRSYQDASKIPMFIGVDEEGGTVNRVSIYPQFRAVPFWSPRDLYNEGGMDLVRSDAKEKSQLLNSLGINLNFAPVADVSTDPSDYMYARSFGVSPQASAEYVSNVVEVMNQNGMGSVLKHFPGYGNNTDTHTGIAIDRRGLESFRQNDFLPFESGIEAGATVVLVSHNIVNSIDSEHPASLSAAAHNILREELGFDGLIITDDLYMDAIRQYTYGEEAAVMAVMAGNDLLCCTDYETQYPAVLQAVKDGKITEERINESVLRILQTKIDMGVI